MTILDISKLSVSFNSYDRWLRQKTQAVIEDLSLSIKAGNIIAIVGASGSGKSLLAHAILGILPPNANVKGDIFFNSERLTEHALKRLRGTEISLIPQSVEYLDPLMTVGKQVELAVRNGDPKKERRRIFQRFALPEYVAQYYPYQLSGGMARRVLVATAAVSGAKLIIADEPTPGLHQSIVHETLMIFKSLASEGTAILFITHDLIAASQIADSVAVLQEGKLVDVAPAANFVGNGERLFHPYTRALWQALPQHQFTELEDWYDEA